MIADSVVAVAQDTADAPNPPRLNVVMTRGESGRVPFTVRHGDGTSYDLTGCVVLLTVRAANPNDPPLISREATVTDAASGVGYFPIEVGDTWRPDATFLAEGAFQGDVWLTDTNFDPYVRYQVVALGSFIVLDALGEPDQPVTVPAEQQPIAKGDNGDSLVAVGTYDPNATYGDGDFASFKVNNITSLYGRIDGTGQTTGVDPTDDTKWFLAVSGASGGGEPSVTTDDNQKVRIVRAGAWATDYVRVADVKPDAAISGFSVSPSTIEVGVSVSAETFSASYIGFTPTAAKVTRSGQPDVVLSSPFTSGSASQVLHFTGITDAAYLFTLDADTGLYTRNATTSPVIRVYFGNAAAPGTWDSAAIQALPSFALVANGARGRTISFPDNGGTLQSWYFYPASFGAITSVTDPVTTGAIAVTPVSAVDVTRNGVTVSYIGYRPTFLQPSGGFSSVWV